MTEATQSPDASGPDIKALRSRLRELHEQKESLFSQRSAVSQKIRSLISEITTKKSERNKLTDSVKAQKVDRSRLSQEIREKIGHIRELKEKLPKPQQSRKPLESPGRLRAQIDELNRRIETEALPFDKEQKIMKLIKDIKRRLDEVVKSTQGSTEVRSLSREIDRLKERADSTHSEVQQRAKASQDIHENILVLSKEVDELKKQESSLQEQFLTSKKEHDDLAAKLGEHRVESEVRQREAHDRQERAEAFRQQKRLSQRIEEVQEKMKKGGKLTTEDILILQGADADE